MINHITSDTKPRTLAILMLGLISTLTSACHVVVPDWDSAEVFGYATSGAYDPEEPYAVGLVTCRTELHPNIIFPTEVDPPTAGYLDTLNDAFPAWTFDTAAAELSDDSIEVKTYDAIGTSTRVGVWIHARYVPHDSDPTEDLHWVQVLTTNHGLQGTGHGPVVTYEDVHSSATTPYYDDGYAADDSDILDRPSRTDAAVDHTWEATTFLATGPDIGDPAGTVTLQVPGFNWGWKNTCVESDGIMEFHYLIEEAETIQLPEGLEPGGKLRLRSEDATPVVLRKSQTRSPGGILAKQIEFAIGRQVDPGGMSELGEARGVIRFDSFEFEGKHLPAAAAEISRGSGFIHWESGEASLEFVVALALPDGKTENMVFTGTGLYDRESKSFTINPDVVGISEAFLQENVPEDTRKKEEKPLR
jgi:hypothetical protein